MRACLAVLLWIGACAPAPAGLPAGASSARGPEASVGASASAAGSAPAASAVASAAPAGSALDAGVAEVGVLPDCSKGVLPGEVVLPPGDASMLSNAAPDASVDRSYPELGPALQRGLSGLRCCYSEARRGQPGLAGALVVEVQLGPDGKAKSVSHAPEKSDIKDRVMGSCVAATLKEVAFPASRRGRDTLVVLPLVFRPGGGLAQCPSTRASDFLPLPMLAASETTMKIIF